MSAEPEHLEPAPASVPARRGSRWRGAAVTALVVLGALLGFLGVMAVWVDRTATQTPTYVDVSGDILADPEVSDAVAAALVNDLWSNVDVPAQIAERLPPAAQPLAGPASAALQELTVRTAQRILARPRAQELWRTANAVAHRELLALIRGDSEALKEHDGNVVLDLQPLVLELAAQIGVTEQAERVLAVRPLGQFVIVRADNLSTVQTLVDWLDRFALVLGPLALLAFAAAVWLSGDRRRTLIAIAFVFIGIGVAVGMARKVGGRYLVDSLTRTPTGEQVGADAWSVATRQLGDATWSFIVVGLVALVGLWLAGAHRRAVAARHWLTPYVTDRRVSYGVIAMVVLLLLWWNPVVATGRVGPMVVGIALAIAGVEVLRHQMVREQTGAPSTT